MEEIPSDLLSTCESFARKHGIESAVPTMYSEVDGRFRILASS